MNTLLDLSRNYSVSNKMPVVLVAFQPEPLHETLHRILVRPVLACLPYETIYQLAWFS